MTKEELLQVLTPIAKGIADTFGSSCETLVQDLDRIDHPILVIFNGHVTGRKEGSTVGIEDDSQALYQTSLQKLQSPHINKLARNQGHLIKSTTLPLEAEDGILGLGINFDFTALHDAEQALHALSGIEGFLFRDLEILQASSMETEFMNMAASLQLTDSLSDLSKADRQRLLSALSVNNFFGQQKSIPYIADKLGVSRYTIYKDLREIGGTKDH